MLNKKFPVNNNKEIYKTIKTTENEYYYKSMFSSYTLPNYDKTVNSFDSDKD